MDENMDILGDEIVMDENPNKIRLINAGRALLFYSVRAAAAYCIAQGFWYLAVSVNSLAQYSKVAQTGMELLTIGIFIVLYITGDPDV